MFITKIRPLLAAAVVSALAACGPLPPPPNTARLPDAMFAARGLDQDVPAVEYAKYAFAVPSRTKDNPFAGAQAVLAMEYIAGALNTGSRWMQVSSLTKMQLLRGRKETRAAVGIAPDASAQLVIDRLAAARAALSAGNRAEAFRALADPAFTKGAARTVEVLSNLPYIPMANISTMHAAGQLYGPDSGDPLYRD